MMKPLQKTHENQSGPMRILWHPLGSIRTLRGSSVSNIYRIHVHTNIAVWKEHSWVWQNVAAFQDIYILHAGP